MGQDTNNHQVAMVTGANKGIGRATAERFASSGFTVVMAARGPGRADTAASEVRAAGGDVHAVTLDVTDSGSVAAAVGGISARTSPMGESGYAENGPGASG